MNLACKTSVGTTHTCWKAREDEHIGIQFSDTRELQSHLSGSQVTAFSLMHMGTSSFDFMTTCV